MGPVDAGDEGLRVFVTSDLGVLGLPELLTPIQRVAAVEVWTGFGPPSPAQLREGVRDADGLLCLLTDRVDGALIEACPRLRVISSMSVGVDHIDVAAARDRGIPVGNTPGVLVETTADLAFALLLAAARRIPEADREVRERRWTAARPWAPDMLLGVDLHGATLGIVGLGPIGSAVARRAGGFGMRVVAWTRSGRTLPGVEATTLDGVFRESDFVSIHAALTPETRGLVGARELAAMRPGGVLVNTARGGIVDEPALASALHDGQLRAAALDVFEREPLPDGSPLLGAPNLVLAPHIGSATIGTRREMARLAVANLVAGLRREPLPHAVA